MSEVSAEQLKPRPLTKDQIDLSLYVEKYHKEPSVDYSWAIDLSDFSDTAWELISHKKPISGNPIQQRKTDRLTQWTKRNRPKMLFFEPDEVLALVANNPKFIIGKEVKGKTTFWRFRLKTEVFPNEEKQGVEVGLVLTRGEPIGVRNFPYLTAEFPADYQNGGVIFKPKIQLASENISTDGVRQELIRLLGVKEQVFEQELDIRVDKKERKVYFDLKP